MAWDLWTSPFDQVFDDDDWHDYFGRGIYSYYDDDNYPVILDWHDYFGRGIYSYYDDVNYPVTLDWHDYFGRDEIEEDAIDEKSCVQVLRYLITTADSEIEKLEKNLVSLQNELAWTEHEKWPEICCSALTERINRLEAGVTTLKSGHADDAELQLLLDNGPAERLHEIVKALYKDQFQDAHGQDLLAISLVRSPDFGVISCVPYHSDRMILSDTLDDKVTGDEDVRQSQLVATDTHQILNPILSKEENTSLKENVCSDDHRLAIIKVSQHIASETKEVNKTVDENVCSDIASETKVKKPFLSKGNKKNPSETKEVNKTVDEIVCSDIASETKVKKPFLSKGNKNIPSETKEVNITVNENVCSDDDRLAIIKVSQHIASETKVKKPLLSKRNKNIPSETKEANITVNENVCSDDDRLAIIKSQFNAINTGQILNPFSSKGNGNIASDAKEENTNLKENVCSDDYKLAIVKEMELYPHSDLAQKLCDFVPKTVRRACRKESKVTPYKDLESMCNIVPKTARRACRKESKVAPDEDLESMSVPLQIVYPQKLCLADTESSAFKEKNGNALQVIKLDKVTLDAENSALMSLPGMQTKNALCTRLQLTDVEEPQAQDLKSKIAVNFSKSNKRFPLKSKAQGKKKPEFEVCSARETLPLEVIPSTSKNVLTKRQRKPKTCTAGTILNEPMNGQNTKRAVQPGQHEIEGNAIVLYDSDNVSTKRQRKPKPCPAGTILNELVNAQNTKRAVHPGQHEIEGNAIVLYDSDNVSTKRKRKLKPCPAGTILNELVNGQNTKRAVHPGQHEIEGNAIVLYDSDNVSTKRKQKSKPCPAGTIFNEPMNSKSNKRALQPGEHRIDGNAVVLYDSKFSELQKKRQVPELSLALVDSHNDSLALVPTETMQTLMKKTVVELKSDAKKLNIKGFSKLLKADLAEKLFQRLRSL